MSMSKIYMNIRKIMGYEDQAFEKHLIATSSTISKYIEVNEQLFQPEGMDQHVDFGEC